MFRGHVPAFSMLHPLDYETEAFGYWVGCPLPQLAHPSLVTGFLLIVFLHRKVGFLRGLLMIRTTVSCREAAPKHILDASLKR